MRLNVVMPQLGESVAEGEVTGWLKKAGERVERDEGLVEVKTDKATVEVPAPASGVLAEVSAEVGEKVAVGATIAVIETSSEQASLAVETPAPKARLAPVVQPAPKRAPAAAPAPTAPTAAPSAADGPRMTPIARRLARELDLNAEGIQGTGAGGMITREDIVKAVVPTELAAERPAEQTPEKAAEALGPEDEAVPLSPMRRRIAARLVHSKTTIPHVTTVVEADLTAVGELRAKHHDAFEKAGLKLTFLPFIMKATAQALKDVPALNSSWGEDKLIVHKRVHLGIAVSVEGGLSVPVIRNADSLTLKQLVRRLHDVADHARAGKLAADEVQGSTFTITNPGAFGSVFSTPIINPPEAGILGIGRIADTPVVRDGRVAVARIVHLCLSYDHRIVDGETALKFLGRVRELLEKAQFNLEE